MQDRRVQDGTGKYAGMLGSYKCALLDDASKTFFVGSGLTDMDRENPAGRDHHHDHLQRQNRTGSLGTQGLRVRADDK